MGIHCMHDLIQGGGDICKCPPEFQLYNVYVYLGIGAVFVVSKISCVYCWVLFKSHWCMYPIGTHIPLCHGFQFCCWYYGPGAFSFSQDEQARNLMSRVAIRIGVHAVFGSGSHPPWWTIYMCIILMFNVFSIMYAWWTTYTETRESKLACIPIPSLAIGHNSPSLPTSVLYNLQTLFYRVLSLYRDTSK